MSRTIRNLTLALGAAVLVAPGLLSAQPPRGAQAGPAARGMGPGPVTRLLNARRQLDLTPRQVAQLDSLERIQFAEHKQFAERMRPTRDSLQARARAGNAATRDSVRAQARARMEAQRPLLEQQRKRDSSLAVQAEKVLNDTQRQKVRELQAERRGFERGMRQGRGERGERGALPGAGMRGGRPPQGGMQRGMQGGMQGGMRTPQRPAVPTGMAPRRPPMGAPDGN